MADPARRLLLLLALAVVMLGSCTASSGAPSTPLASSTSSTPVVTTSSAAPGPTIRDLAPALGLRESVLSFGVQPRDFDGDGWTDVLVIHHSGPKQVLHNDEGRGLSVAVVLDDVLHGRRDSHDCAWGDVDHDEDPDIYCTKGAQHGEVRKWNELWIQGPAGVFEDHAAEYGVEDRLGRGRRPTFIDLNHDPYPDLFVGNETDRRDGRPTPNRTFLNVGGRRFREVHVGLTREIGSECVQAVDVDGDGWEDLVLCGVDRLFVFLRRGARFVPGDAQLGISSEEAAWARAVDLNGDERLDLVVVRKEAAEVQLGRTGGGFGSVGWHRPLEAGHGLAVGDVDGVDGPDLLVVQGCMDEVNVADVLLRNRGDGLHWKVEPLAADLAGCGDVAAALDFDGDGLDEFYVLNGRPLPGPEQLLTMGDWQPPG